MHTTFLEDSRQWIAVATVLTVAACVGDDPVAGFPSAPDAGSSGSSGEPAADAGSGDAAVDDTCNPDGAFVRSTLVPGLETTTVSDRMTLTADELQLFYSHTLESGEPYSQVYSTVRSSRTEPFPTPPTLREDLSSLAHDYNPAISPDGKRLVLVSSRGRVTRLYVATREDSLGGFTAPVLIDLVATAATGFAAPTIAVDGTLYFARRNAQTDDYDHLRAAYAGGQYGTVTALPDFVSASNETDLVLAQDGRHAFFSSDRPLPDTPDGGSSPPVSHVWQATRESAGAPWAAPVPLAVDGLDLGAVEAFVGHVSADGCRLYFELGSFPNGRAHVAFRGR